MADLPRGTVTFLFTDIEGSTRLLHELGADGYTMALAEHRRIVRNAFTDQGGVEVDTQGDSFLVAFADAPSAVRAAKAAQLALRDGPVRVRMGLHTGVPSLGSEGYVGRDVHLGARIAAAGHGGQILMSKHTAVFLDESLSSLGEHRLKDIPAPVWIYQLGADRFPPLKTISNSNLPREATSFLGREREVAEITALLNDGARLVTLTGPGGTGKTRLAIASAAELVLEFPNGVFWVDLAPLRDPSLVSDTIARTIGARSGLSEHIGERQMLLVLDNFEQVVAAAPTVSNLVSSCPNLRLLNTSREVLRVVSEVEYAVPPLATHAGAELFCERSGVELDETITEVCRRLDNLPLAIELAAARTSVMSPAQILDRIGKRLDLLKGGRDADPRHQTLRATIAWSHDLLSRDERRLFAKLSVFRGGFTLEAAESVADADIDVLQSLVEKSLVRHSGERFDMLETIRDFASERLDRSAGVGDVNQRHATFFLKLAEEAEPHLENEPAVWYARLEAENDNLRAALDYLEEFGQSETALRIAGALAPFWQGGHLTEGQRRFETLLRADGPRSAARAKALFGAALMARQTGDAATARSTVEEALTLYRELGAARGAADASGLLGLVADDQGDSSSARQFHQESAALFQSIGDEESFLGATHLVAATTWSLGDRDGAREVFENNLARARALGYKHVELHSLALLGLIAVEEGRLRDSMSMFRDLMAIDRDRGVALQTLFDLSRVAYALAYAGNTGVEAALLVSSTETIRGEIGAGTPRFLAEMINETVAMIHKQVDDASFKAAWEEGKKLTIDDALALALRVLEQRASHAATTSAKARFGTRS